MLVALLVAAIAVGGGTAALTVILIRGTAGKTRFGLNPGKTHCPNCGECLPRFRKPANARQALWGGWTCPRCGTEADKWGRPIEKKGEPA